MTIGLLFGLKQYHLDLPNFHIDVVSRLFQIISQSDGKATLYIPISGG